MSDMFPDVYLARHGESAWSLNGQAKGGSANTMRGKAWAYHADTDFRARAGRD
jgi:broad specificity phosphatase PhoE